MQTAVLHSRLARALVAVALISVSERATAVTGDWVERPELRARLISRLAEATAGGDPGLGLEVTLADGWHVYWKNAGDAGYAPVVEARSGLAGTPAIRFPAPHRFELPGDLVAFGYEKAVVYPLDARLDPAAAGTAAIATQADLLVCKESCIPYKLDLALALPIGPGATDDSATAALLDRWRAELPLEAPAGVAAARLERGEGEALAFHLELAVPDLVATAPDLFFEPDPRLDLGRPVATSEPGRIRFRVPLRPIDETSRLPDALRFAWTAVGFERTGSAPIPGWESVALLAVTPPGSAGVGRGTWVALFAALVAIGSALFAASARRKAQNDSRN